MALRARKMELRRQAIIDAARSIILADGIDALTTRHLALRAGLTPPTLYSLVGDKADIIRAMMHETAKKFQARVRFDKCRNASEMIEAVLLSSTDPKAEDLEYLRAVVIAGDRLGEDYATYGALPSEHSPSAIVSVETARMACQAAIDEGLLQGNVSAQELAEQLYISYRGPLRDWAYQFIGVQEATRRVRRGFYLTLAADAHPEFRRLMLAKIRNLDRQLGEVA